MLSASVGISVGTGLGLSPHFPKSGKDWGVEVPTTANQVDKN